MKQLSHIKLYDSISCHHIHLKYKCMGGFVTYRPEGKMGYIGSGGWGGIRGIIIEANN